MKGAIDLLKKALGILILLICVASFSTYAEGITSSVLNWTELPELPITDGLSQQLGLAGAFSGVHQDALIVAGGANFPDGAPWNGGEKVWYDDIYVLEKSAGGSYQWYTGFKLPRPLAYGASLSTDRGLVCIGGCDANQCYSEVFLLSWNTTSSKRLKLNRFLPFPNLALSLPQQ